MPTVYRVRRWAEVFENNRTRELKTMSWAAIPCEQGDGYTQIAEDRKHGPAIYGVWIALVTQVAARCDPRGTLVRRDGTPHDPESVARIIRFPAPIVRRSWTFLASIGWLEPCGISQEDAGIPQDGAPRVRARSGTEQEGMEGNGTGREEEMAAPGGGRTRRTWTDEDVEAIYGLYPRKEKRGPGLKAIEAALRRVRDEGVEDPVGFLTSAVTEYRDSPSGQKPEIPEDDFRPHPASWFNAFRYHDDRAAWQKPNRRGSNGPGSRPDPVDERKRRQMAREFGPRPEL